MNSAAGITTVGEYAFSDYNTMETLCFPAVETIGGSAFSGCTSLETVSFSAAVSYRYGAVLEHPGIVLECSRMVWESSRTAGANAGTEGNQSSFPEMSLPGAELEASSFAGILSVAIFAGRLVR